MWVGDVVADRFEIVRPIGSGGMGSVFLATDRLAGGSVALKVLDLASEGAVERFRREARVLSELSHPGIVRFVAHGETDGRQPFLVMELLEGEDLAQRLARGGLSPEESLGVLRHAADALAFAHGNGIVHRDVKPSNLFLVGGDVERVKVLDFGIARANLRTQGLTQTGAMLGTVGYMAPEQATGSRDVEPRADVFALGCVFFECLTGRPAFVGDHAVAVLAKVLTEEAPRVSELRPGLGQALDSLVARMLAKSPEDRPADARAVLSELDILGSLAGSVAPRAVRNVDGLTGSERRIVSVILAESAGVGTAGTITPDHAHREVARVQDLAATFGAQATPLVGGALILVLSGGGGATDLASRAASCALGLRQLQPELRVVLATGLGETTGAVPVGPVIDRAATLLRSPGLEGSVGVVVDDVTAGLLGPRFEVGRNDAGHVLTAERESETPRLLLGHATPCVGREKELALLEATLEECTTDGVARAVIVTAAPGVGKSRLASEFVARVRKTDTARVLTVRAEAIAAGSGSALAQRLVRSAAETREADPADVQFVNLRSYLIGLGRAGDVVETTVEFLGEVAGVPTSAPPSPLLRAARQDPAVMREQKRRAFEAWLGAEAAAKPLLMVLEDLHWGDAVTAGYLESALRGLADVPFMVLALARPEVHEQFPNLFKVRGAQEIRLAGLTRRAAERLVGAVMGGDVAPDVVSKVVERADGNAFYLEELIRRVAEGDLELPETVVAVAQSRLERLEPDARRVLRAASVFGEAFWVGGVAALIADPIDIGSWVEKLVEREVLVSRSESRFADETECSFRHALLRDAAYAMLTDEDRRQGHRLAGGWLERVGEPEAGIVAHHFEQAGEWVQAQTWLSRAGEMAFARSAYRDAVAYFNRAIAMLSGMPAGVDQISQELGLQIRLGRALFTSEGYSSTGHQQAFQRALELCHKLGDSADAATTLVLLGLWGSSSVLGDLAGSYEAASEALRLAERTGRQTRICWAHVALGTTLLHMGNVAGGRDHLARSIELYVEARHATEPTEDPGVMALSYLARAKWLGGQPGEAGRLDAESLALAHRLQKPIDVASALTWGASLAALMHEPAAALEKATAAIQIANELGLPQLILQGRSVRAWALVALGNVEEGLEEMQKVQEVVSAMVRTPMQAGNPHLVFLTETLLRAGRFEQGLATMDTLLNLLHGWNLERSNLLRIKGDLLLGFAGVSGEPIHLDHAERSYRDAIEDAREQGAFAYELRAAIRLSRALGSRDAGGEAREILERALGAFRGPDETADTVEARRILEL